MDEATPHFSVNAQKNELTAPHVKHGKPPF